MTGYAIIVLIQRLIKPLILITRYTAINSSLYTHARKHIQTGKFYISR